MDSAYISGGVSVASDPFSSGLEGVDEDHYGYVLPTERDFRSAVPHGRTSRNSKSTPKTDATQEYELMNKQTNKLSSSPTDSTDHLKPASLVSAHICSSLPQKKEMDSAQTQDEILPQKRETDSTQSQENNLPQKSETDSTQTQESEKDASFQPDNFESAENCLIGSETLNDGGQSEEEEQQPRLAMVEYEYMDIRTDEHQQNVAGKRTTNGPNAVEREAIYQNISQPLRFHENPDSAGNTMQRRGEYVDMEASGRSGCEVGDYQNVPVKGRPVVGEESQNTGLRSYIKVCAGVEPQNTSFDNPDYWHSRLFHKQDTVCT